MHLVLGYPGPVAQRVVALLLGRGEKVSVIVDASSRRMVPDGVHVFEGVTTAIDFGLTGGEYARPVQDVDQVYCAEVPQRIPSDIEESPLVRCASELKELVKAGGARGGVRFLSSLLVFGDMKTPASEHDFDVDQGFSGAFEEAAALAEKLIRSVCGECAMSIVRIAPVVADEEAGTVFEHSPLGSLARAIDSALDGFEMAFTDAPIRFETVERAAQALIASSPSSPLQVLHVVDEEPLSDRQLVGWLANRANREVREVSGAWKPLLALMRSEEPGGRAFSGWDLLFSRSEAERAIPELLDRDDQELLGRLFPQPGTEQELAPRG